MSGLFAFLVLNKQLNLKQGIIWKTGGERETTHSPDSRLSVLATLKEGRSYVVK